MKRERNMQRMIIQIIETRGNIFCQTRNQSLFTCFEGERRLDTSEFKARRAS